MSPTPEAVSAFKELFMRNGIRYVYRKGEFVIRPGEQPPGVFYIESGLVKAYDLTKYGEENILVIRQQEEVFPLIWGVTGQERHIIYEAMVPTSVRQIKRQEFLDYINNNPDALSVLLDITLDMYRLHSERIINLGYRNVRERLVSYLLSLAVRFGKTIEDGHILLDVPLRYQDIGSAISASRETVGRELQVLERKGLLETREGYIILHDVAELEEFL